MNYIIVYLGKSAAGTRFASGLIRAFTMTGDEVSLCCSRDNPYFASAPPDVRTLKIATYRSVTGLLISIFNLPHSLMRLKKFGVIAADCTYIFPMNTPLSCLLQGLLFLTGHRVVNIIHDATRHPGDPYRMVTDVLTFLELRLSSSIIFLTESVMNLTNKKFKYKFLFTAPQACLFHPVFSYVDCFARTFPIDRSFRLLFLGRIKTYKGLDLLLNSFCDLRGKGINIELTIAGDGVLPRHVGIGRPDIYLINRHITEDEIGYFLSEADLLVLPYIEASQSGVAASALTAALPILYTPVGGLSEQLEFYGAIKAQEVSSDAVSNAILQIISHPSMYEEMSLRQLETSRKLSWRRFVEMLKTNTG